MGGRGWRGRGEKQGLITRWGSGETGVNKSVLGMCGSSFTQRSLVDTVDALVSVLVVVICNVVLSGC